MITTREPMGLPLPMVPLAWVYPEDMLKGLDINRLAAGLRSECGCQVWVLKDALIFSLKEVLGTYGRAADFDQYQRLTAPLYRWMEFHGLTARCAANDLKFPFPTLGFRFMVSWPELEHDRTCCFVVTRLKSKDGMAFRITSTFELKPDERKRYRQTIEEWIQRRTSEPLFGERLVFGDYVVEEFKSQATPLAYAEDGFAVKCSQCEPCSWPWLELYLEMRNFKPKRARPSIIMFYNWKAMDEPTPEDFSKEAAELEKSGKVVRLFG